MNRLEYIDLFQCEAGEYLEVLTRCTLHLEKEPDHHESLQESFRAVHSLKGMAGTMGYRQVMEISHCLENLLEGLKSGTLRAGPGLADILFEAIDLLQTVLNNPEEEYEQAGDFLTRVNRVLSSPQAVDERSGVVTFSGTETALGEAEKEAVRAALEKGKELHLVVVTLVEDAPLKSVRVYMLLQKLAAHGEPVATAPGLPDLENENFDRCFRVILAAPSPLDHRILKELTGITDVERVELLPWDDRLLDEPAPAAPERGTGAAVDLHREVAEKMVRVETAKLDELVNLAGEMVVARTRLLQLGKGYSDELDSLLDQLKRSISNLQDTVMKVRMVPVKQVFDRFPRMVRDISRSRGKEVRLLVRGEQTALDRTIVNRLSDPLVHLLRNAIDHGIEPVEQRSAGGKNPVGTILLQAYHEGNHVVIQVEDDGAGIDPEAVRQGVLQKGLVREEEAALMTGPELLDLIFWSGFSTSGEVTAISGRGVGLDAVKSSVEALHGTIQVESVPSALTRFTLRLPLTLSIINSLLVRSAGQILAIPIETIHENIFLEASGIKTIRGAGVINLRGEVIPLHHLGKALGFSREEPGRAGYPVVIVEAGGAKAGLIVEQLIGQQEILLKPLGRILKNLVGIAGAAILGDGSISLIVDVPGLLSLGGE